MEPATDAQATSYVRRQKVFRWLAVLAAFVLVPIAATAWIGFTSGQRTDAPTGDDLVAAASRVGTGDGIAVIDNPKFPVATMWGNIDGTVPGKTALRHYARLFADEFSIYPVELITKTQLKSVVFCENLSFAGQTRSAVPDFSHDVLYLDVSRGAYSRLYLREVLHHEFYHIIDLRDDGLLYQDDSWSALNAAGFHYGTGGKNAQGDATAGTWTTAYPGFLDRYATTGVEEDKAETFACMMVDPTYMNGRATDDAVLAAKVRRMKVLMRTFCPEAGDAFWDRVAKKRESEGSQAEPQSNP